MARWSFFDLFKRSERERTRFGMPNALYGYFEIRVDRIVGWVKDVYNCDVSDVQIDVLVRSRHIASVAATAQPENRRFVFSLPIEDRFTSDDLVREEVIIIARDSDGNSGRILLDGATQLELIREHLAEPAAVILDLDFSRGGNARPYLGDGWSGTEDNFTWTEDDDSFISFDAPNESGNYVLRMTTGSLIRKPHLPTQRLNLFINAMQIAYVVCDEAHAQFHEFRFTQDVFAGASRATLHLHHPDAVSPSDLGESQDKRRLAFNFKRLTIVRLLSCCGAIKDLTQPYGSPRCMDQGDEHANPDPALDPAREEAPRIGSTPGEP